MSVTGGFGVVAFLVVVVLVALGFWRRGQIRSSSGWMISFLLHTVMLGVLVTRLLALDGRGSHDTFLWTVVSDNIRHEEKLAKG